MAANESSALIATQRQSPLRFGRVLFAARRRVFLLIVRRPSSLLLCHRRDTARQGTARKDGRTGKRLDRENLFVALPPVSTRVREQPYARAASVLSERSGERCVKFAALARSLARTARRARLAWQDSGYFPERFNGSLRAQRTFCAARSDCAQSLRCLARTHLAS